MHLDIPYIFHSPSSFLPGAPVLVQCPGPRLLQRRGAGAALGRRLDVWGAQGRSRAGICGENHGKILGKRWKLGKKHGKLLEKLEHHWKIMGNDEKVMETYWKIMAKVGKSRENHGKNDGKPALK